MCVLGCRSVGEWLLVSLLLCLLLDDVLLGVLLVGDEDEGLTAYLVDQEP